MLNCLSCEGFDVCSEFALLIRINGHAIYLLIYFLIVVFCVLFCLVSFELQETKMRSLVYGHYCIVEE